MVYDEGAELKGREKTVPLQIGYTLSVTQTAKRPGSEEAEGIPPDGREVRGGARGVETEKCFPLVRTGLWPIGSPGAFPAA